MELSDLILSRSKPGSETLPDLLSAIRRHLGLDVAFISEFVDGKRVFRHVDPATPDNPVQVGAGDPLEESYCQRIVDGRLPGLIPDARKNPEAASLPVTHAVPVGAHLGVPVRLADGSIYGTFCCFSRKPDESLRERDLNMLHVFADVAAKLIEWERAAALRNRQIEKRIRSVLDGNSLSIMYQPIYDTSSRTVTGFEALSRFSDGPARSPDIWFGEANAVGLGEQLEEKAIALALEGLPHLPQNAYLSINISPEHVLNGSPERLLAKVPLERIVLELTEHVAVAHYQELLARLRPMRDRGMRIAVDDAGAGFASFRHILHLAPDRIKLDMSITRNIDNDRSRRALAAALIRFSEETGSRIVAEGVETQAELEALQRLGVVDIQGYLLGRALSLRDAAVL
ncbi:MAG TPA: EAL domain-containing protein [Noviherbaspirillum sp.]